MNQLDARRLFDPVVRLVNSDYVIPEDAAMANRPFPVLSLDLTLTTEPDPHRECRNSCEDCGYCLTCGKCECPPLMTTEDDD